MNISTRCDGFTLVETMVAFFILSVGLLGMALLQTQSVKFNTGSYARSQSSVLAYDIIERMRINLGAAGSYPTTTPSSTCSATIVSVANDLACWQQLVASRLPDGSAAIAAGPNPLEFTVTLT